MTNKKEYTVEDLFNAWGQPEKIREILRESFLPHAEDPDDPHDQAYYEDLVEVSVEFHRDIRDPLYFAVEIEGERYEAKNEYEFGFLAWIRQLMKRGLNFEQAFVKAREIAREDPDLDHIDYELQDEDKYDVEEWIERLTEHGIGYEKALPMAEDIVKVLQQQYWVQGEEWFEDFEVETSISLLQKIDAVRASQASA